MSEIDSYIERTLERKKQALIYSLLAIGEQVRNEAVLNGSYKDQTRHLRGSVGYILVVDGQLYNSGNFGKNDSPSDAKEEGRKFAESLVRKYPKGVVLICVAGKNYAAYVAAKGYNVIDSSELLAGQLVPKMLRKLGFK